MYIEAHGAGADLVLIHGWAMHGGIFAPLVEALAAHFRVHVVDLPGHGFSREETHLDIAAAAARIARDTPPAIWLGWSLGGLVALRGALDAPEQVRGLVEVASSPRFVSDADWTCGVAFDVFAQFERDLQADAKATIERFLALETLGSAHAQMQLRELGRSVFSRGQPQPQALADGLHALENTDLRDALPRLSMPGLWIAGRRDRLVHPDAMRWAATQAPRARCLEFNSGHAPFLEFSREIADAVVALDAELVR